MSVHNRYEVFSTQSSIGDVFKKASQHSRRISLLKIFLPLSALVSALIFCWFTFFLVPTPSDPMPLNNEESGVMNLTMLNPKLEGYTRSHEPYWLKAEKAFQDHTRSGIIGLQNITARVSMGQQRQVFLAAQGGVYNNINGFLELDKPFTITTNDGMMAQFMSANINLSEGQLKTDQRVNIQRAGFHLVANALQVREKGKNMYFYGGVHLMLQKQ
ncbi:LPS export ABC transporter periplasmic protein LptC [Bartonella tribocorum]|uniref:LPS export ABC transporter periplasmic protein LptC n=1 Tax=Bartonella tribocorum TaxID=85701 RepID=A0A2M6UVK0_9HYPH|nr:LPS export ABC transporter periplasmic protein LptC [Bartonella tribocorum]PIT70191.1 LPS export ABC transporter periplasmic protein LptC [Bartonella tribocorum]